MESETPKVISAAQKGEVYQDYDDLKQQLEHSIAATEKRKEVELDSDFLEEVDYHTVIVRKTTTPKEQRSLVSEQNTQFKNSGSKSKGEYKFANSYEESSSLSMTSTKGYSISIGSKLGASYMGGSAGVNAGYQYSKNKGSNENKGDKKRKELCLTGSVDPKRVVIVKEQVYEVQETAKCEVVLTMSDKAKIPYTYDDESKSGSVEMKKLFKKGKFASEAIKRVGNNVTMNITGSCTFSKIEHVLEVITQKIDKEKQPQPHPAEEKKEDNCKN